MAYCRGMEVRSTAGILVKDIVLDFVKFPVWWYSTGTKKAALFAWDEIRGWLARLSLVILFRNLLKPMYGDSTKSGRAISLVMRLIVFVVKLGIMVVWTGIVVGLLVVWLALPVVILWFFVRALGGGV